MKSQTGTAVILLPQKIFKKIFRTNPRVGRYNVPPKMKLFAETVEVTNLKVE